MQSWQSRYAQALLFYSSLAFYKYIISGKYIIDAVNFQLSSTGNCGTFGPLLAAFKVRNIILSIRFDSRICQLRPRLSLALKTLILSQVSAEKLALIHNQWTVKLNELAKEMSRYAEELHRKHKQVKDEEAPTLAAVRCVQVKQQIIL